MPLHAYSTDREPPSVWDHTLAHPFELMLAFFGSFGGILALFAAISSNATVSPSLDELPEWLGGIVGALLIAGGAAIIRGLLDDSDDLMKGWRIERSGLILTGFGWASYGVTIVAARPAAVLSWGSALCVVLMVTLRFVATVRQERRVRKALP